ncbi:MAG: hypothetical protein ACRDSP_23480 [Pseudonocardiaceae bacterium]
MSEGDNGAQYVRAARSPLAAIKIVFRPVEGAATGCVERATSTIIVDPRCAPDVLWWTIACGVDILLHDGTTGRPPLRLVSGDVS